MTTVSSLVEINQQQAEQIKQLNAERDKWCDEFAKEKQNATDEEIATLGQELAAANNVSDIDFARAIEAAVLAKLREQKPVAWRKLLCFENGAHEYKFSHLNVLKDGEPLYLHPAPIPEGYALVPVEPTDKMWFAGVVIKGDMAASYKAMLAAARSEE